MGEMKKLYKFMISVMCIMTIVLSNGVCAFASEADTPEDVVADSSLQGVETAKDSVVQVVVYYTDDNGRNYILKRGSGFLISENTVLTNYEVTYLSNQQIDKARKYLSLDQKDKDKELSYQVGVIVYNDVIINAQLNSYSSKDIGVGILDLSSPLNNRTVAVLGDASSISPQQALYVLGYRNVRVMDEGAAEEYLTQNDLKVSEGSCIEPYSENEARLIHTAVTKRGALGGPTVNENGVVVGMNITTQNDAGNNESISVISITGLLDACGITYTHVSNQETKPDEQQPETEVLTVDKSNLNQYILNYSNINKADYTEDSYKTFYEALTNARNINQDESATQEEVDNAVNQLNTAKENLVSYKPVNWPLIILIIVIVIIFICSITLYVLKAMNILFKKKEPQHFVTEVNSVNEMQMNQIENYKEIQNVNKVQAAPVGTATDETTVLGATSADDEGTIVLNSSFEDIMKPATLIRSSNGEKISINVLSFIVGKDALNTNYCIKDNPSISRRHAKISFRGNRYYICDLGSTNFSYVNNQILSPETDVELKDGDIIRLSNEEFMFKNM